MGEVRLSPRERRILSEIEESLGRDTTLDRELRTMRRSLTATRSRPPRARRRLLAFGVAAALATAATLMVRAVQTGSPALVWAFAVVWALTVGWLTCLLVRWCRRCSAPRRGP
ncbi:DUF3040 domain-containing protein [Streptomyces tritici]|uniref:DUF3040 domain-containing protein n=1 Tax=Streptomyces tritici TaxID=2054410 RepID=UPI003AF09A7A